MSLDDLLNTQLPMNRKERFFTGTVFPMIVGRDNFRHFQIFTNLLQLDNLPEIDPKANSSNIQFFTEYGFLESCYGSARERFREHFPQQRDTPDILVLIRHTQTYLIAIEAKVYDNPTAAALTIQIQNQAGRVLRPIAEALKIERKNVHQAALLPEALRRAMGTLDFPVVTWERLLSDYEHALGSNDYWLGVLRIALNKYEELVARPVIYGKHMDDRLPGRQIYSEFKKGTLHFTCMGRNQGLRGDPLKADIDSGAWERQLYEVNRQEHPPNFNWFRIEEFINLIDAQLTH
jgi:hypothetical protein